MLRVNPEKCRPGARGIPPCMKSCPEEALSIVDGIARIDHIRCDYDGICIPACPRDAIELAEK